MTIGSPVASAVSGPGVDPTNAMRLSSGDQVGVVLDPGNGALVPPASARTLALVPSARTTARPFLPPTEPRYASHCPSCDQTGSPEGSFSPPGRTDLPSATVM